MADSEVKSWDADDEERVFESRRSMVCDAKKGEAKPCNHSIQEL